MTKLDDAQAELEATKRQMGDLFLTVAALRGELSDVLDRSIEQRKQIIALRSQQDQTG